MNIQKKRLLALSIYLLLIFLPLIALIVFPMPPGRDFWRDFSVALGFVGLSMAGMQFIPTARLNILSDLFDMDRLYKMHHLFSVVSVFLIFLHPIILVFNNPYTLLLLNPFTAPWRAQAGLIGLAGLLLIGITSVLRKEVKLGYDLWHSLHDLLAGIIAVFALVHIFKVNYYTATPVMTFVWIFEAAIWVGMTLYVRVIKPVKMSRRPFLVDRIITETPNTWTLVLKPDGHEGLDFNAAQVAWININTSPFRLHRNPFSISGSAHRKDELKFTIKALGDFSSSIGELKGGERVYVDGPFGNFSLEDPKTREGLVLLAGGIGSAPIMSILYTMSDSQDKRPVYLFYGNYDEANIIFKDELERLKKELNLNIIYILEEPPPGDQYEPGFITKEMLDKYLPDDRHLLYYFVCGPLPMIDAIQKHLMILQIPDIQITTEKYEMA
jgi:predicted ferric reductase